MNTVEIPSQHIEFVFENCEAINVDVWAIETLNFDVSGERYTFDTHRKNLLKQIQLGSFYIKMDLSNPKHFYHTNRLKDNNITTEEDGEQCKFLQIVAWQGMGEMLYISGKSEDKIKLL